MIKVLSKEIKPVFKCPAQDGSGDLPDALLAVKASSNIRKTYSNFKYFIREPAGIVFLQKESVTI